MAVRMIRKGDDPVLRTKCVQVQKITPVVLRLLDDLAETMYSAEGLGLAAPQIGISKRLVVINTREDELLELINPEIIFSSGEDLAFEGCLSFPGLYGEVPRAASVKVKALNRTGHGLCLEAGGILSRALQHEIDHLNGILFIDRATRFVQPGDEKE